MNPKLKSPSAIMAALTMTVGSVAFACSTPREYVEMSRVRVSSSIASVFALPGNGDQVNVTARLDTGSMIMMTIPSASVAPGKRLVVDKVVHEDKLKNVDPKTHYDFVELLAD